MAEKQPAPLMHRIAFDDTDTPQCGGDYNDPCTYNNDHVNCEDCLVAIDDYARGNSPY